MFFVAGVVLADLAPEGIGMIHVVKMGELVDNNIVAQDFWDLHETDIERNCTITATTSPASGGMRKSTFVVAIAVKLGVVVQTIRQIILSFFHEDFFLGVTSTLSARVA